MKPILCLILALASRPCSGESNGVSRVAFSLLVEASGARASSLGNAYAAVAGDSSAVDFNPAGLALLKTQEVSLAHQAFFQDVAVEQFKFGASLGAYGGLCFAAALANYGEFEKRDENGQLLPGTVRPSAMSLKAGYGGWAMKNRLCAGASFAYLQQKIETESQKGFDLNLGGLYILSGTWRLAGGIKGLGGGAGDNPLPTTGYLGAAARLTAGRDNAFLLAGQSNFGLLPASLGAGMEYQIKRTFFARAGYSYTLENQTLGALRGLSGGFGISFLSAQFDYAVSSLGDLGLTHSFTLVYRFEPATD